MTGETREKIRNVLERKAAGLRELKRGLAGTLGMTECPACGVLVGKGGMAEHASMYSDAHHVVLEVMSS